VSAGRFLPQLQRRCGASRLGYIARNPVTGVRFLPEPPGSMRIISHDEQLKYLKAASHLLRDVATLMLETGMRPEEVFTIGKEECTSKGATSLCRAEKRGSPGAMFR
jgi:integrase